MYVIITKIAITRSTLSAQNSLKSFGGRAPPGPTKGLSAPADSLSVAGRRCGNKGMRKRRREEGKEKKGKGSFTPTKFIYEHLSRSPNQNQLLCTQRALMSLPIDPTRLDRGYTRTHIRLPLA